MKRLGHILSWLFLVVCVPIFGTESALQQLKYIEINRSNLELNYEKTLKEIVQNESKLAELTKNQTLYQTKKQTENNTLATQIKQTYQLNTTNSSPTPFNQDEATKKKRLLIYQRYLLNYQLKKNPTLTAPQILNQQQITALTQKLATLKEQQQKQHQELENLNQKREQILARPDLNLSHPENLEKLLTTLKLTPKQNLSRKAAMRPFCIKKISPTEGIPEKFNNKNNGILITAPLRQEVRAIANGRVVFVNWLAGYGFLVIIDHGRGFISFYGRNRNLYTTTDSQVKAGEIIATVGDTGGYTTPALYFAIRYNQKPTNPVRWCKS